MIVRFVVPYMPLVGYLVGSIPFALIIGKSHGVDIRTVGSKNIGATNLGRTLGMRFFWYAFLLDTAKGFIPVLAVALMVRHCPGDPPLPSLLPLLTAVACVFGHTFPIWLKFKGGKGVATSLGVVLGFWPLYTIGGIIGGLTFILFLMAYRYISLASLIASVAFALAITILSQRDLPFLDTALVAHDRAPMIAIAWLFVLLIVIRHRANISRLLKGTEPKVGSRK